MKVSKSRNRNGRNNPRKSGCVGNRGNGLSRLVRMLVHRALAPRARVIPLSLMMGLSVAAPLAQAGTVFCPVSTNTFLSGTNTNSALCEIYSGVGLYNNSYSTLTNQSGGTLNNYGFLYNRSSATLVNEAGGILNNYGALNNSGTLTNKSGGTLNNLGSGSTLTNASGATLTNNGTLNNSGTMANNGAVNNYGALSNSGTLNNLGASTFTNGLGATLTNTGAVSNSGMLKNYGALSNKAGGTLTLESGSAYSFYNATSGQSGTLDNYGTLNLKRDFTLGSANAGVVNLKAGGTLNNYATLDNAAGHVQDNSGTLNNSYYSTLNNSAGSTLNNLGTLNNYGTLNNAGTLNNSGTLYNSYYGTLNNQANATLTNTSVLDNAGHLSNGGTLTNTGFGTLTNTGTLDNTGTLNNNVGTTVSGPGGTTTYRMYNNGILNNSGTLNNTGWLSNAYVLNNQSGGLLTNSGQLSNNYKLNNYGTLHNTSSLKNTFILNNYGAFTNDGSVTGIDISSGTLSGYFNQLAGSSTLNGNLTQNSVTVSGGSLTINSGATVTTNSFTQTGGATMLNGGTIDPPTITVTGGSFGGSGAVVGDVSVSNATLVVGTGGLNVTGNLSETDSIVNELINGASTYSVLNVSGALGLNGGTLDIATGSGFSFAAGQVFDLFSFSANSLTGSLFNSINLGSLDSNGNFISSFSFNGTSLDLGNGLTLGLAYNNALGNIELQVQQSGGSGGPTSPVPEPREYAMLLAGLGLLGLLARRRQGRMPAYV